MEREGFRIPLLIGGATTGPVHTAVKIAPAYSGPVVHVPDASRAASTVGNLLQGGVRDAFIESVRLEQEKLRSDHSLRKPPRALVTLDQARARKPVFDWEKIEIAVPSFTGVRSIDHCPLEEIIPFIDWSPFFHAWELRGRYPAILEDPAVGERARDLWRDAQSLLGEIAAAGSIAARAAYGFFPANSVGDDIQVYADASRSKLLATFHSLRQQSEKPDGLPHYALADFIAPKASGRADYLGAFALTAGIGVEELCRRFESQQDDYRSILAKALADRLAEAFAEMLHKQARREWRYGLQEDLGIEDLLRERYRGIRPAPGYPACPDHTEKRTLFDLLAAESRTGIELTDHFAMLPASSVCGLYFSHPEARYFAVGRIGPDQAADYAERKRTDLSTIERWLGPNLGYDPEKRVPVV
jgi:5-methyltetrahydrofolate--homocysteine methyltransferase